MKAEKKPWSKPQLLVLGRGTPEERVLAHCKHNPGGPIALNNHCQGVGRCPACHDDGGQS